MDAADKHRCTDGRTGSDPAPVWNLTAGKESSQALVWFSSQ